MSRIKRLTEIMTPAPFRSKPTLPADTTGVENRDLTPVVKPLLKNLVTAESASDAQAKIALSEIKEFVRFRDAYAVAMAIKVPLQSMPRVDDAGMVYHKSRAYLLAADLFLVHIQREFKGMRKAGRCLGLNIFRSYCTEIVECLMETDDLARAVEVPVMLADELLREASDWQGHGGDCMRLAQETLRSARHQIREKHEQMQRISRKRLTPVPGDEEQFSIMNALDYVETIENALADPQAEELCHFSEAAADQSLSQPWERLHTLLGSPSLKVYRPWMAIVKERIAALTGETASRSAQEFLESAAKDYETQGDHEKDLHLLRLCRRRYQKARDLYRRTGAAQADQVETKLRIVHNQCQRPAS